MLVQSDSNVSEVHGQDVIQAAALDGQQDDTAGTTRTDQKKK